ncbi:MAG: Flp pilus assembly protein TadG [Kiritimatiellia bacterium]|jgi:Flp pilus assembly protein TadG
MRRAVRGSYNAVLGFLLPVAVGFAALSVDVSYIRLAESQTQDAVDAAAHGALIELRLTGDKALAEAVAKELLAINQVADGHSELGTIEFGIWDPDTGDFEISDPPNAVRVTNNRKGDNAVKTQFAKIWNINKAEMDSTATSTSRSVQIVLVMDITGSFKYDIKHARAASLKFLSIIDKSHGPDDMIGMVVFSGPRGYEWTPMFKFDDRVQYNAAETQWATLESSQYVCGDSADLAYYMAAYPVPLQWCGECCTDHHVGIVMGTTMLAEQVADPFAFKAMVVLTDGLANNARQQHYKKSYAEDAGEKVFYDPPGFRWYQGPTHDRTSIIAKTKSTAVAAYDLENIHIWMVSYSSDDSFLHEVPKGDGNFFYTADPSDIEPIFTEIAQSLPVLIVK